MTLQNRCSLLIVSAAICMTAAARAAHAQTVIVRSVPPRSTVELILNDASSGTATADAAGDARLAGSLAALAQKEETEARVIVDSCGETTRVLVVETVHAPPAVTGACRRQTVPDVFIVRPVTTLVVDMTGSAPSVLIRQGPPPQSWLGAAGERGSDVKTWTPAPTGLVLSAALGLGAFSNAASVACGDVTQCNGPGGQGVPAVGATFWMRRFLAAEVMYMTPAKLTTTGAGTNFRFANTVTTDVLLIAANAGGQAGPVRLYAFGGPTYQRSITSTTQTVTATATNAAATGTFAFKTRGWGWAVGGGVERWLRNWIGIYAEGGRVMLKGKAEGANQEGALDDTMTEVTLGVRVHLAR